MIQAVLDSYSTQMNLYFCYLSLSLACLALLHLEIKRLYAILIA